MNRIALGLFIFQVIFTLADFSPYRDRSHRFGKFDTRVKGKYVFFLVVFYLYFPDTSLTQRALVKGPDCLTTGGFFAGSSLKVQSTRIHISFNSMQSLSSHGPF